MSNITEAAKISQQISEKSQILNAKLMEALNSTTQASVDPFIFGISIFVLACFVGYFVVWKVTPALHTPLMAVTNAISSVIVVGAIVALGSTQDFSVVTVISFIAIVIASVNIFGGFLVTWRMLQMFKK